MLQTTLPEKFCAIDTETTGLDPWRGARIFAMAASFPGRDALFHYSFSAIDPAWLPFRDIIEDPSIDKVFTNAKFDWRMIEHTFGWQMRGRVWDTTIFCHLLDGRDAEGGLSLDAQARKYTPQETPKVIEELEKWCLDHGLQKLIKGRKYMSVFKDMPVELIRKRCVGDAQLTRAVFMRVYRTVATVFPFLLEQEHRLLPIVKRMEDRGVLVDENEAANQALQLHAVVGDVTRFAEEMLGWSAWNINARKDQVALLQQAGLFERINEWTRPSKKRKSLKPFVPQRKLSAEQLYLLHHPVSAMLMVGKQAAKLISPFLTQAMELATDGVLHASFNQCGTTAGRFSSSGPNLQNIPVEGDKKGNLTEAEAEELTELTGYRLGMHIKRIFLVRPGYAHIHSDKKQVEMVMLAHYSNDPKLLEIFHRGESIHDGMCKLLFPHEAEITKGLKQRSKQVTFGYQYGMGIDTLAKRLRSALSEAIRMRSRLESTFLGLPRWNKELAQDLRTRGYVETIHGRRHYLRRNEGYMAVNRMCQGTVGDEVKSRMVAIGEWAESEYKGAVNILLNIHDDVATEVPQELVAEVGPRLWRLMEETSRSYRAPLPSTLDITYTCWGDLKEIKDPNDPLTYPKAI